MNTRISLSSFFVALTFAACSDAASTSITYRADVALVTRVEDALPGVFIPPFLDCRAPAANTTTSDPSGKVCTQVSIAGATEPDKRFAEQASCDVVRTQRPYYPVSPAAVPSATDPRLTDAAFMADLRWAKSQIEATGCACCHSAKAAKGGTSQWDIDAEPIWLDTLSDSGLALFAGFADSSVLGAYAAADNHGFDRTLTGIPTTDTPRMKAFVTQELTRRGITEAQARTVPPFGGPIYTNSVRVPTACAAGEGIDDKGRVIFSGGKARYVYVLEAGSKNPGVPPNLDRPTGTLWRLDVLPSAPAVSSGLTYGTTPSGTYQDTPAESRAPSLVKGTTYQLFVLLDVGLPITNCLFVYGDPLATPSPSNPADMGSGTSADAFGATCASDAECSGAANYCSKLPGQPTGYCTATGCVADPSVCPDGWGCFDISVFQPGAPSVCTKP